MRPGEPSASVEEPNLGGNKTSDRFTVIYSRYDIYIYINIYIIYIYEYKLV